jgi:hypothetical protein
MNLILVSSLIKSATQKILFFRNADLLDFHIHQFFYFRPLDGLTVGEVFKNFVSDIVKFHSGGGKIGLRSFVNSYKTPHLYEGYIY